MTDSAVYSTQQVADRLKLGPAMVRKYALAYERISGDEIPNKKRDGRQFSAEHYSVIAHAKGLIDGNQGLSVDTALRMALGTPQIGFERGPATLASSSEQLPIQAILDAAQDLRAIRSELTALRAEVAMLKGDPLLFAAGNQKLEPVELEPAAGSDRPGLVVRLTTRLDRWFKR